PGSKYTEADRTRALLRALEFLHRSSSSPNNFDAWASDYLFCFYEISSTARNPELRAEATRLARGHENKWAAARPVVPANASSNELADLVFGWYPAALLGQSDARIKPQLRSAIANIPPADFLLFDPAKEPPPADIPAPCRYDHWLNPRGSTVCRKC